MKPLSDAIQTLISVPDPYVAFAGCVVVVVALLQCLKFARVAIRGLWWCVGMVRKALLRLTWRTAVVVALLSVGLMSFRFQVHDALQLLERNYLDPTYISPSDTSAFALSCYENALSRNLSETEAQIVKQRTRQLAARIGSTPLAIYEVAWSECGLNPFTIRKDGLAAGWIQFTTAGLDGLGYSLDQVKAACQRRDIGLIMDLTDAYILRAAICKPSPMKWVHLLMCILVRRSPMPTTPSLKPWRRTRRAKRAWSVLRSKPTAIWAC